MRIVNDLMRYADGSFFRAIFTILFGSNFQMIFWYRFAHFLSKIHLSILSKIIMYFHKIIFSVDIDYRCEIGGGLKVVHGLGIVIGKDVVIEENVTIYQGVTLGGNGGKKEKILGVDREQPYIHSGVNIFAGAVVIGPCEIGENSVIGAGALIMKSIAPNTIVYNKTERVENSLFVE